VKNYEVEYIPGGATQNTIRIAQTLLQKSHPANSCTFVGCVGKDDYAEQMRKACAEAGFTPLYLEDATTPTGTCAVLIKDKERSLCANLAAANKYKQTHLESAEVQAVVKAARVYYISGFFMTVSCPSLMSVAKHSFDNNKTFCMNLGAEFLMQFYAEQFQEALPYCNIIFGNESEALAYAKTNSLDTDDIATIAKAIQAVPMVDGKRSRTVIITQGKDPTIVVSGADGAVSSYAVDPLAADLVVDTNGAGDSFCGGFFASLLQEKSVAECVKAGSAAARLCVQQSGCVLAPPAPPTLLLGMGNPLLDISANVPQAVFDKYGLKPGSAVLAEEKHQPIYAELVKNYEVEYIPGGATQNTIRIAQTLLQKSHPANSCTFVGCVGKDDYAEQMRKACAEAGFTPLYLEDATTPTGTCAVLIKDKERSLCANLAAANKYKQTHLESAEVQAVVKAARVYYISGFFMTVSCPSLMSVAKHSFDNNKTFCMNLGAEFLMQFYAEQFQEALPYCNIIFGNESEALAYAKTNSLDTDDIATIAKAIQAVPMVDGKRSRTVIITQGKDPTIVVSGADGAVSSYAVDPLAADLVVDTNGAGDSFCGGFFASLLQGKSVAECVKAGSAAARLCVQQSGCVLSAPARPTPPAAVAAPALPATTDTS